MKKSLILLALSAAVLSSCLPAKKKSSSGSSGSSGSSTSGPTTSGGGGESSAVDFVLTAGTHTAILDFENDPDRYTYPRAEKEDTEAKEGDFGGLTWNIYHTYKGSYEGQYWLMMVNKNNWCDEGRGQAWIGNKTSLGSITSIEVTVRTGASAKKSYDLSVGSSAFTSAQTGGTEFAVGTKGTYTGSGDGFFAISTKAVSGSNEYNGQIAQIKVTYTIS